MVVSLAVDNLSQHKNPKAQLLRIPCSEQSLYDFTLTIKALE